MLKKILMVVEDNPLLIGMYEGAFRSAGYEVICAHDGETGIKLAKEKRPTNIVLDLLMPGTDGFEVINTLKNNPETKEVKIVVITSDTEEDDLKRAKELGAVECLIKSQLTLAQIVERSVKCFE